MDGPSIEKHINTFGRQIEVASYLSTCEMSNTVTEKMVRDVVAFVANPDEVVDNLTNSFVPTLFGTTMQKIQLCVLLLISEVDIKKIFGLVVKLELINIHIYVLYKPLCSMKPTHITNFSTSTSSLNFFYNIKINNNIKKLLMRVGIMVKHILYINVHI